MRTILVSALCFVALSAHAGPPQYKKSDIAKARFGEGERARFLSKAYKLASAINQKVIGQEQASAALQERVVNYFENFGSRSKEPIALNLIGLPGIGKTAMLTELRDAGFPIVHVDAQKYASLSDSRANFANDVYSQLSKALATKLPVILVVEEIDKVPEIKPGTTEEISSELIGSLNQILSDGRLNTWGQTIDLSNIMVLTTMNFSPAEMEAFTGTVLEKPKSFYDLNLDDMVKFDTWIRTQPSARYKILSRIFRSNTVSRLAPNTIIMKPLSEDHYRQIAKMIALRSVEKNTTGANGAKRVSVEIDPSLIEFLVKETVYPPSGARETVFRADALVEQLVNFGMKLIKEKDDAADHPRKLSLSMDLVAREAVIKVTNQIIIGKVLKDQATFEVRVKFDEGGRLFIAPLELIRTEKIKYAENPASAQRVTKKMILQTRFPVEQHAVKTMAKDLSATLLGQEEALALAQADLDKFLGRTGPSKKEPSFRVLSGFPGIGKSELVKLVQAYTKLPVVRVNMQQFSSDQPDTVRQFFDTFESGVVEAKRQRPDGKFIFLIEELDKAYEIDATGRQVNRPIMGVIKDLMNEGVSTVTLGGDSGRQRQITVDIRNAMTFVTMNFSVDRFGFKADPRLTTIDDVIHAWKSLKMTPMAVKDVLGKMFLPETVSRLMSRFTIMKPLSKPEYRALINRQAEFVIKSRLIDEKGLNRGQIDVRLTPAYKAYLFNETVIPSEGARNTVMGSQGRIASDLEKALESIPKSSRLSSSPILLTLDYRPGSQAVVARAQRLEGGNKVEGEKSQILTSHKVALTFPPLSVAGAVSVERMETSAHEFGHAFVAARLGLRFGDIVVVPPAPGMGGYVTLHSDGAQTGVEMMSQVYAIVASRALERMVMSKDPLKPESVLRLTSGPSRDILMATKKLYTMLYELGMDPHGGTIDRNVTDGPVKYAAYQELPSELAEKLSLVLRDMETAVLADLLKAHSQEWYVSTIAKLAGKGAMSEAEFYELIGRKLPNTGASYGTSAKVSEMFKGFVKNTDAADTAARKARYGLNDASVEETVESYVAVFAASLKKHLHPDVKAEGKQPSAPKKSKTLTCAALFH